MLRSARSLLRRGAAAASVTAAACADPKEKSVDCQPKLLGLFDQQTRVGPPLGPVQPQVGRPTVVDAAVLPPGALPQSLLRTPSGQALPIVQPDGVVVGGLAVASGLTVVQPDAVLQFDGEELVPVQTPVEPPALPVEPVEQVAAQPLGAAVSLAGAVPPAGGAVPPAAAEPAPPAPTRLTHHAESAMDRAAMASAVAEEAYMTSSANSGLSLYERQRNARIAGNQAHMAALGLGGGLAGGAGRAPRAQRVNYSASDAAAAERARLREEARVAREAGEAEKAARLEEKAAEKDAKLAKFTADYAIAVANGAAAPDMSVLSAREGVAFRKEFLAHAVLRYPGQPGSNGERYVIEVDAGVEIKCQGVWSLVDSTQVSKTGSDLDGKQPSTKTDAAWLLDQAYADAGKEGGDVFKKGRNGLWGVVLYKDRKLNGNDPRRADAVVAWYKDWLPPWQRAPTPAAPSSKKPQRSTRKRKRS